MKRFWDKVQIGGIDECWEWLAGKFKSGYGAFQMGKNHNRKVEGAHRLAYKLKYGPIKDGLHVLHRCDNRACVNWRHLFLGTHLDNIKDMTAKKRQVVVSTNLKKAKPGEDHYFARLTWEQVRAIRKQYAKGGVTQRQLAKKYGVIQQNISLIIRKKNWKE